jgi:diaminopimelate epimerase
MSDPRGLRRDINLVLSDGRYNVNFVNTGVPHAVIFVDHLESQDVKTTGKEVRYHSAFAPRGANADFVEAAGKNLIKVRTYERGVEDETLACGTGVTASAIISAIVKDLKSPVVCLTKGGDRLKIYFKRRGNDFTDVYLEGGAREAFLGRYLYK